MRSLLWATALPGGAALAQDELLAPAYGDEATLSIATGAKQSPRRAPAMATVISADELRAMGATDLEDMLARVPGAACLAPCRLLQPAGGAARPARPPRAQRWLRDPDRTRRPERQRRRLRPPRQPGAWVCNRCQWARAPAPPALQLRNIGNADIREPGLAPGRIVGDLPQAPRSLGLEAFCTSDRSPPCDAICCA